MKERFHQVEYVLQLRQYFGIVSGIIMARFLMGSAPQLNTFYDRLLLFGGHKHAVGAPSQSGPYGAIVSHKT